MACLPGSDPLAEPLLLCHFLPPTLSGLATRSHFHLSSFMLLSQLHVHLVAPSIHRILEPATTCSVFARPSFAQHQICDSLPGPCTARVQQALQHYSPYPSLSVLPAPPLYRLRPGPSSRSWNFVCVAQHRRRGPVKRVECIALRCQAATLRIAVQRGGGSRAMQNAVFYCGVELSGAWHCKEGREGGGRW